MRKKTGGGGATGSVGAAASQPGGDADLFAARNLVSSEESANLKSAWMLRQGAGDLLTYIAARSVRLGVIAGPRTTPGEFESFVKQLRQQSIQVTAAVPPEVVESDGMEAGVERAGRELGAGEGGARAANVLVVGSSEPLLSAATAANMFTARFHPLNSRREGVIQTFTVRSIDEVGKTSCFPGWDRRSRMFILLLFTRKVLMFTSTGSGRPEQYQQQWAFV